MLSPSLIQELNGIDPHGGSIHTDAELQDFSGRPGLHALLQNQGLSLAIDQPMPERISYILGIRIQEGQVQARYSKDDGSTQVLVMNPHPFAATLGFKARIVFFDKKYDRAPVHNLVEQLLDNGYTSRS
ncbi:MAG TPA: hypothetical protein VJJ52_04790 [Candidatus Nanoarchaeia archaeon]|nr:hypothetical protein [Candidatus Nanoarchaeia archaeon]